MEKNDLKGLTSRGQYLIFLLTWVSLEHGSFLGTDCTVILRCCKPKLDKKCRSYVTLKHQRILNLQFASFFRGLKRGLFDQIRCSQWPQGMVLDGLKGFQSKKSKSMTFNYKSVLRYLVVKLRSRSSPGPFLVHSRSILSHSNLFQFKIRWSGPGADVIFTVSPPPTHSKLL